MIYYTVFTIFDAFKALFGYRKSEALRMVPLQNSTITTSPPQITQGLHSNQASASTDDVERDDTRSIHSTASSTGNGATKKYGHATLRGSPKALGWTIDEEEEHNAWVMLMSDAVDGSVFESRRAEDDEEEVTSPIAPSNQDIIKFFGSQEERGVSYVWRIIPSLKGAHRWVLHRHVEPVEVEPEVVREMTEMQTDTVDLVEESHQETSTQTIIKTYSEAAVQVDEPVQVPEGALAPLSETPTDLVDVLPADLRPISPPSTIPESISGSPPGGSKIPRLASRRGSIASFRSSISTRTTSPVPDRAISPVKALKTSTSIRSLALRRASSAAVNKPALPASEEASAEKKKTSGGLFNAVKRIGRTDSTVKAWRL